MFVYFKGKVTEKGDTHPKGPLWLELVLSKVRHPELCLGLPLGGGAWGKCVAGSILHSFPRCSSWEPQGKQSI